MKDIDGQIIFEDDVVLVDDSIERVIFTDGKSIMVSCHSLSPIKEDNTKIFCLFYRRPPPFSIYFIPINDNYKLIKKITNGKVYSAFVNGTKVGSNIRKLRLWFYDTSILTHYLLTSQDYEQIFQKEFEERFPHLVCIE